MKVKIERTARELRQDKNGRDTTGVMFGGQWYNMPGDMRKYFNKEIDVEVKGKWARLIESTPQQQGSTSRNGHAGVEWWDYKRMMEYAHSMAKELEPDVVVEENQGAHVDRSRARSAILNSVMIAFADGKIVLPKEEDAGANGADEGDDIPF
jgi:hypothetical protein